MPSNKRSYVLNTVPKIVYEYIFSFFLFLFSITWIRFVETYGPKPTDGCISNSS